MISPIPAIEWDAQQINMTEMQNNAIASLPPITWFSSPQAAHAPLNYFRYFQNLGVMGDQLAKKNILSRDIVRLNAEANQSLLKISDVWVVVVLIIPITFISGIHYLVHSMDPFSLRFYLGLYAIPTVVALCTMAWIRSTEKASAKEILEKNGDWINKNIVALDLELKQLSLLNTMFPETVKAKSIKEIINAGTLQSLSRGERSLQAEVLDGHIWTAKNIEGFRWMSNLILAILRQVEKQQMEQIKDQL